MTAFHTLAGVAHKIGKSLALIVFYPLLYVFWWSTTTPREKEEEKDKLTLLKALRELWR